MSFDWEWDIVPTLEFIRGRGFASAALQFPDELLGAATNVAAALQGRLGPACKLYVLADTAYNPLAVDEVAAQHANAQCVIHYGPASLSPVNTLPAFFVFPKARLPDPSSAAAQISAALASSKDLSSKPAVVLLLDQAYAHGGAGDVLARAVRGAAAAAAAAARSGPESPDAPMPQVVVVARPAVRSLEPARPAAAAVAAAAAGLGAGAAEGARAGGGGCCAAPAAAAPAAAAEAVAGAGCGAGAGCSARGSNSSSAAACCAARAAPERGSLEEAGGGCCADAGAPGGNGSRAGSGCGAGTTAAAARAAGAAGAAGAGTPTAASGAGAAAAATVAAGEDAGPRDCGSSGSSGGASGGVAGMRWELPPGVPDDATGAALVWVGDSASPLLQALQLAYGSHAWLVCEPGRGGGGADGGGDAGGAAGGGGAATAASAAGVDAGDGADRGSEQAAHSSPPLVLSSAAGGGTAPTAGGGGGDAEDQEQATATHASSSPPASPPLVLSEGMSPATRALLRRRYFLVEKAKGASIVGILAGTLACAGFTDAIAMVRRLAHAAGKKTYTLVMGKPNPAKLANFPEIDVFVMVADPLGFILDCKEYLAPIISPHEARLAFTDQSLDPSARYPLDFNEVLRADAEKAEGGRCAAPGGGAASGAGRGSGDDDNDDSGGDGELVAIGGLSLAAHASIGGGGGRGAVAARDAAQYLATRREYTGLVTPLVGGEVLAPVLVVEGRSGRAAVYEDEPSEK